MKLSDFVAQALADHGVSDIFLVSGGGIMHLLDSIGRHRKLTYHAMLHEQAAVIAAEGYSRKTGKVGVALVTVGPGAANAASGLPGAWTESIPILVLAGQVRRDIIADYSIQRQLGPQEANTLDMARPVTKYAVSLRIPQEVGQELAKALQIAREGRPGPVWIEFPLDVQAFELDSPARPAVNVSRPVERDLIADALKLREMIRSAERPIFVGGNGIRSAGAVTQFAEVLSRTSIPAVFPFSAKDILPEDHPSNMGIIGTAGQRRANFAVQNSTLLIGLGVGFSIQKIGFNYAAFAPGAMKFIVDIDPNQLNAAVVKPDFGVKADAGDFLKSLLAALDGEQFAPPARWLAACKKWKDDYPLITTDYLEEPEYVNSYLFWDEMSRLLRPDDTIVPGNGLDSVSCYQAFRVRAGQRVLISAWGSMGWDLPLAIGACIGGGKRRTIVVTGDGSIQWNLQELGTIAHKRLPMKIFILNNRGYSSIRATQNSFFGGHFVGADEASGVGNPNFELLAAAFGLPYHRLATSSELKEGLRSLLSDDKPVICELCVSPSQFISPKASAFRRPDGTFESRPLEDMAPFLPRDEVYKNMHLFDGGD